MAVPSNYAALITAIDAILTTYGLSLFQVFGGRSTQPSLRELISLRWKLFSMTTPANYATLIAEIDVVIESYGLSLQEVFGGRSTQPTLQELIDLRYELFEVDGGGAADPSQIVSSTLPTTRVNPSTGLPSGGDPLQIGDRWYKPSVGQEAYWNGTLWLTQRDTVVARSGLFIAFSATNTTYTLGTTNLVSRPTDLLFLRKLTYTFFGGTFTADNRWEIFDRGFELSNRGGSPTFQNVIPSSTTTAIINNQARVFSVEQEYNIVLPLASGATEAYINEYKLSLTRFNAAPTITLTGVIMEFSRVMS